MSCKLILPLIGLGLAGCAPVDPGMGEALKYDMAIQTINPDPVYAEAGSVPGDSGDHAAAAAERYRKGDVKETQRISIQSATNGGGSGGSGGGSGPQ